MRVLLFTGDKDAYQLVTDRVQRRLHQEGHHRHRRLRPRGGRGAARRPPRPGPRLPGAEGRHVRQHPRRARASARRPPRSSSSSTARSTRCSSTPTRSRARWARTCGRTPTRRVASRDRGHDPPRRARRVRHRQLASWGDIDADAVVRSFTDYRMVVARGARARARRGRRRRRAARDAGAPRRAGRRGAASATADAGARARRSLGAAEVGRRAAEPAVAARCAGDEALAALRAALERGRDGRRGRRRTRRHRSSRATTSPSRCRPARSPSSTASRAPGALLDALRARRRSSRPTSRRSSSASRRPATADSGSEPFLDAWEPARTFDVSVARLRARVEPLHLRRPDPVRRVDRPARCRRCDDARERMAAHAQARARARARSLRERLERDGGLGVLRALRAAARAACSRAWRTSGSAWTPRCSPTWPTSSATRIDALRAEILELAGTTFNDRLAQAARRGAVRQAGPADGQADEDRLLDRRVGARRARADYPIAAKIIEYRELTKLKSTYIDALPRLRRRGRPAAHDVQPDGRGDGSPVVAATRTCRTSRSARSSAGGSARRSCPRVAGDVIVSADYSQIELRILAHLSGTRA